jgi:hypothetical protein
MRTQFRDRFRSLGALFGVGAIIILLPALGA